MKTKKILMKKQEKEQSLISIHWKGIVIQRENLEEKKIEKVVVVQVVGLHLERFSSLIALQEDRLLKTMFVVASFVSSNLLIGQFFDTAVRESKMQKVTLDSKYNTDHLKKD